MNRAVVTDDDGRQIRLAEVELTPAYATVIAARFAGAPAGSPQTLRHRLRPPLQQTRTLGAGALIRGGGIGGIRTHPVLPPHAHPTHHWRGAVSESAGIRSGALVPFPKSLRVAMTCSDFVEIR
jgi:hypothetical protein